MSSLKSKYARPNDPFLCRLPQEIQDEIISGLELHRDLISLALSCRALKNLVVPRHSDYRVLRVRHSVPSVWAHLARRKDLAKNCRQVFVCKRYDYTSTDHWPSHLVDPDKDDLPEFKMEEARVKNICQALENMVNLTHFAWSGDVLTNHQHEVAILEVLAQKKHLKHLFLSGDWGRFARGVHQDPNSDVYPLWRIGNLESLMLLGNAWIKPPIAPHLVKMFARSPQLQKVQLPMEFTRLPECYFPNLKSLSIILQAGARANIDPVRAAFIQRHPTLEELFWVPLSSDTTLPAGSLPRLRTIRTFDRVLDSLVTKDTPLSLDTVQFQFLDSQGLTWLQYIKKDFVKRVSFAHFDGISYVTRLVNMFPHITHLHVGECHKASPAPLSAWIKLLSSIPNLEVFRGDAIWNCVGMDKEKMHLAILTLIERCPKLRSLDHYKRHSRRNHDVQRITILREGPKGLNVRYIVEKPPPRSPFDNIGSVFD